MVEPKRGGRQDPCRGGREETRTDYGVVESPLWGTRAIALARNSGLSIRDKLGIILTLPLPRQEIVIPAAPAFGKLPANRGPCVIYRAAAAVLVKKLANGVENVVLLVPEDALAIGNFGIPSFGFLNTQTEVPGEAFDISLCDIDPVVAAAVGRAFLAVIQDA